MLICCVKTGNKYDDGYVRKLQSGIARNLPNRGEHLFVCYTDKPVEGVLSEPLPMDLPGWWAKIGLFKLGIPLIYFDLDVVITGDLTRLIEWDGFGIIKDWWSPTHNSSVMKLTGKETGIFENFHPGIMKILHGDQDFISGIMPDAKTFPPEYFVSYKANKCQDAVPEGAMAVIFHGRPKPSECGGWVAERWR